MNGLRKLRRRHGLSIIALMIAIGGCVQPIRTFAPEEHPDTLNDTAFLHYLATVPVVSVDEGMRAVLLLTDTRPQPADYKTRLEHLLSKGAVRETWQLSANQRLDKGTLAYMLRTICELRGGLSESLAARTGLGERRYALKTCVHAGLLRYARPGDPVTGGELLSALTAAEPKLPDIGRRRP